MATKHENQMLISGMPAKITSLVEGESDRGAILILGAYLEELLSDVVRSACVSDEYADKILEFRQAAGDFSSKISLCAALGLIHEKEEIALNALRKVRNSAAHFDKKGKGFDVLFDSDPTIDQVGNIAEALDLNRPARDAKEVKNLFIVACRLLATKIRIRALETQKPKSPITVKEMANKVREALKGTEREEYLASLEALIKEGDFDAVKEFFKDTAKQFDQKLENAKTNEPNKS